MKVRKGPPRVRKGPPKFEGGLMSIQLPNLIGSVRVSMGFVGCELILTDLNSLCLCDSVRTHSA